MFPMKLRGSERRSSAGLAVVVGATNEHCGRVVRAKSFGARLTQQPLFMSPYLSNVSKVAQESQCGVVAQLNTLKV